MELRPPRRRTLSKPASPSGEVTPDSAAPETAADQVGIDTQPAKPASPDDPVTPDAVPQPAPVAPIQAGHTSASSCELFRDAIALALSQGRNAKAIWQDLVDIHGFGGTYQSVKRFARQLQAGQTPEARAVIQTAAGEESQVDYGTGPMVRDPATGKYRRTRLFVLTLGYSRKSVRLLTFQS